MHIITITRYYKKNSRQMHDGFLFKVFFTLLSFKDFINRIILTNFKWMVVDE